MRIPSHRLLGVLLLGIIATTAQAQIIPLWSSHYTGPSKHQFPTLLEVQDGTLAVPGYFERGLSIDGNVVFSAGEYWPTGFVAVYKEETLQFTKKYGREYNSVDYATSVAFAPDGSLYIGGNTGKGSNTVIIDNIPYSTIGAYAGTLAKISPDGTALWGLAFDGPDRDNEYVIDLDVLSNGDVVAVGRVQGGYAYLAGHRHTAPTSALQYHSFAVQISSNGQRKWSTLVASTGYDYGNGVEATPDGGWVESHIVGGPMVIGGVPVAPGPGGRVGVLVKRTASAVVEWVRPMIGPYSWTSGPAVRADGTMAVVVHYTGAVDVSGDRQPDVNTGSHGHGEALAIFRPDGTLISVQPLPFGLNARYVRLRPTNGDFLVFGSGTDLDRDYDGTLDFESPSDQDIMVYDPQSQSLWMHERPGVQSARGLTIDGNGSLYASVSTAGYGGYHDGQALKFELGIPISWTGGPPVADLDEDGVPDVDDNCPIKHNPAQDDRDNDQLGDVCDPDDDNDGVLDEVDVFPFDPDEWADADGDQIGDNADLDDDNDGVFDIDDAFPFDPSESVDTDGDGIGNNGDTDDDDDGLSDEEEAILGTDPLLADSDGDGYDDKVDVFPLDDAEWMDSDGDGVGDNGDIFPTDPTEWSDLDEDGVGDNADLFDDDPTEAYDLDLDGLGDNADVCDATVLPDPAPSQDLGQNRWTVLANGVWYTNAKKVKYQYTLADTGGCGCADIIEEMELGKGHQKFGCSSGVLDDWIAYLNGDLGKGYFSDDGDGMAIPETVVLENAWPNPFNPTTSIRFGLPEAQKVRVAVYDVVGRQIEVLTDGVLAEGFHTVRFDASSLPSGIYLLRMDTLEGTMTRSLTLLK